MGGSDVRSYGEIVKRQVRENPAPWLALAALLAWMFGLYWSDLFVVRGASGVFGFLELRSLWLASEAVTLLVVLVAGNRLLAQARPVAFAAGTCLFAGTLLVLFAPTEARFEAVVVGGVVLSGVGSALLLSFVGIMLARRGPKALLVDVALALLAASAFDALSLLAPTEARLVLVSLLPVACTALVIVAGRRQRVVHDARPEAEAGSINAARLIVLPLVVGLAYGLMQRLTGDAYAAGGEQANVVTIASFLLSAAFIALAAQLLDSRNLVKLVCFAAIPVMGVAFVMLPLFSNAQEAAQAVCIVGFNSFYFMVWALWSGEAGGVLPRRFVLGLLVLVASEALGLSLGVPVVATVRESGSTLAVVSLVVVYLLLMAAIFLFDRSIRVDGGSAPQASARPDSEDGRTFDGWAERYGLSARETEVFALLARGRNRTYISKTLFVSDNTTRTHMKNIYRKLGVHSQQELIDLVEGKEA